MKKLVLPCLLLCVMANAQSKFSYSVLVNQSASADDQYSICIFRTTGGECIDFEKNWKTNITLATNYQVNKHVRMQVGLAYNVLSLDKVNEVLERDAFKINYLSIPVRTHYFVNRGKLEFYAGAGLRTDIRLNDTAPPTNEIAIQDNGRKLAVSAEALLGVEFGVTSVLRFNIEPTFSWAITSYGKDLVFPSANDPTIDQFALAMVNEFPKRIGISFGVTYSLAKATIDK